MQNYILVLLVPVYMLCHTPKNNSDVIVTYEGHAEAGERLEDPVVRVDPPKLLEENQQIMEQPTEATKYATEGDEVIFLPNERVGQDDGYMSNDEKSVSGLLNGRRNLDDIVKGNLNFETEAPQQKDIVFVTGKNNERVEDNSQPKPKHSEARKAPKKNHGADKQTLDCSKLDCNKTSAPVCGGKIEHNRWRYRLFLNECFFRKVNCGFNFEINRYTEVDRDNCHNVTGGFIERPHYRPDPQTKTREVLRSDTRRVFSGRRSSNTGLDGNFCSHTCPVTCSEDYKPECAVSNNGEKRVFVNHCSLDYNSCYYNVAWHRKPLSECVGSKAADLRQNRGFISWMHRIGIIDAKGRLTVSA